MLLPSLIVLACHIEGIQSKISFYNGVFIVGGSVMCSSEDLAVRGVVIPK